MKFYASVALATILMIGTASAQSVNIGVKAGVNFYNVSTDGSENSDTKTGLHAGLLGHIHLAPQVALQPEIMYSSQGATSTTGGVKTKLNLDYINVPVLLQYMFDNGFRLQAGPQIGFLVSAKEEENGVKTNIKDGLKSIDFGIGAGVGYVHPPSGFGVDLRYNLGLSNISEVDNAKVKNRGVQLGVFYLFNHKN